MSKAVLRSLVELRPLARLAQARLLVANRPRAFNSTPHTIEPSPPGVLASAPRPAIQPGVSTPTRAARQDGDVQTLLPDLASQPSHYITIHIHGRPYLVTVGDAVRLPFKMPGVLPGDVLRLNRASALGSRDFTLKGSPYVNEALFECRAVVLGTETEPMRIKIKRKQRNRKRKTVRSKHSYTVLRIQELTIAPVPAPSR